MNDSGDSFDWASSKWSTTVASTPLASSSSSRCSALVSSLGADSGRTILAGWRSKVSTAERACSRSASLHLVDDCQVADVHTVVGADRYDGPLAWPRRPIEIGDDLHGR